MQYLRVLLFLAFAINTLPSIAQKEASKLAIGKWRDHQCYSFTKHVEDAGDKIFVSCDNSLFSYEKEDGSMVRYSKVSGLSDAEIATIAYDKKLKTLFIAYANSNIDLLIDDRIYNISGLKNKNIDGDKAIYNITFEGNYAYLSCGFGILVIDIKRKEIKDTYIIGDNASRVRVNNIAFNDTSIIAATDKGVLYADKTNKYLANFQNWKRIENTPSPLAAYKDVAFYKGKIIITTATGGTEEEPEYSFYYIDQKEDTEWTFFFNQTRYTQLKICNDKLVISCHYVICILDTELSISYFTIREGEEDLHFDDALIDSKNKLWLASRFYGLFECLDYTKGKEFIPHSPSGPVYPAVLNIRSYNNVTYLTPGGRTQQYAAKFFPLNLYVFEGDWWYQLNFSKGIPLSALKNFNDLLDVTIDHQKPNRLYASTWSRGLLEIEDKSVVKVYDNKNSPLQWTVDNGDTVNIRISGTVMDSDGDLWVLNSMAKNALCIKRANESWDSIYTEPLMGIGTELVAMFMDPTNEYKWIVPSDKINKIFVYNREGTRGVYINPNKGSKVQSGFVNSIAFDYDDVVWIGTNRGIKVIYSMDEIFENTIGYESQKECNNIVYVENDKAQYLLEFENISTIVVDGGNRKWVGTMGGGAFLISADGSKQLLHFSKENSPLPSNNIVCIGINEVTGEVFFGTDRGTVSFKSEATGAGEKNENVYVFPNPIRPNYSGPIAIKGLVRNAVVKITDISGNIVYNTKALGGQAIWDGKNMKGRKVASGVYLVFATNEENTEKVVTKMLFLK